MENIAKRATQAIKERADKNGTSVKSECEKLNISRKVYSFWKKEGIHPHAYFLQQMALAGYDIYWILTGKENKNVKD